MACAEGSGFQRTKTGSPREPIFRPMQITWRAESLSALRAGSMERDVWKRLAPGFGTRTARRRRIGSAGGGAAGRRRLLVGDLQNGRERVDRCGMRGRAMRREREREFGGLCADCLELRDDLRVRATVGAVEARFERVHGSAERRRPAAQRVDDRAQRREHGAGRLPPVRGDDQADRAAVEIRTVVGAQFLERVECVLHEAGHAAVVAGRGDDDRIGFSHGVDQLALCVGERFVFGGVVRQRMQERAVEQARACAGGLCAAQRERQCALGRRRGSGGAADADDEGAAVLIECSQGTLLGWLARLSTGLKPDGNDPVATLKTTFRSIDMPCTRVARARDAADG